jgi:hypothetical protein
MLIDNSPDFKRAPINGGTIDIPNPNGELAAYLTIILLIARHVIPRSLRYGSQACSYGANNEHAWENARIEQASLRATARKGAAGGHLPRRLAAIVYRIACVTASRIFLFRKNIVAVANTNAELAN